MSLIRLPDDTYVNVNDACYITQNLRGKYHFMYSDGVLAAAQIENGNDRDKDDFHAMLKTAGFIQGFTGYSRTGRGIVFANVSKIASVHNIHTERDAVVADICFLYAELHAPMRFMFLGTISEFHTALAWRPTVAARAQFDESQKKK